MTLSVSVPISVTSRFRHASWTAVSIANTRSEECRMCCRLECNVVERHQVAWRGWTLPSRRDTHGLHVTSCDNWLQLATVAYSLMKLINMSLLLTDFVKKSVCCLHCNVEHLIVQEHGIRTSMLTACVGNAAQCVVSYVIQCDDVCRYVKQRVVWSWLKNSLLNFNINTGLVSTHCVSSINRCPLSLLSDVFWPFLLLLSN